MAAVLHLTLPMADTKDRKSTVLAAGDVGSIEEGRKPSRCEEMLRFSLDRCERLWDLSNQPPHTRIRGLWYLPCLNNLMRSSSVP